MKCKKVKRLLPLFAGNDLSSKKTSAVKAHLRICPECRREYRIYIQSFQEIKEGLQSGSIDWDEEEWLQMVEKAIGGRTEQRRALVSWPFKPAWALGFMAIISILVSIFLLRSSLFRDGQASSQEVVEMTLVSRETGLKVKWFLNKNFNLEEESE